MRALTRTFVTIGVVSIAFSVMLLWAANWNLTAPKQHDLFPQRQDCQSEGILLRFQVPKLKSTQDVKPEVLSEPIQRSITNCGRLSFQFFRKTSELTGGIYWLTSGLIEKKNYGVNGNGEQDLIVYISHLQPATSILDPTIATNLVLLTFEHELQSALSRGGKREPLGAYDVDRFFPAGQQPTWKFHFVNQREASSEFVGECTDQGGCRILVYSKPDSIAFGILLPYAELDQLGPIIDQTRAIVRRWRVE